MPVNRGGHIPQRGPFLMSWHSTPGKHGRSAHVSGEQPPLEPSPKGWSSVGNVAHSRVGKGSIYSNYHVYF